MGWMALGLLSVTGMMAAAVVGEVLCVRGWGSAARALVELMLCVVAPVVVFVLVWGVFGAGD